MTSERPAVEERVRAAVPPLDERGRRRAAEQDWNVELLDARDPDERAMLVRLAHPELDEAIEGDLEELVVDGVPTNPRLHLAVHEIVAQQIVDGDPPEMFETASRLLGHGCDPHEVLHMLASVVSTEVLGILSEGGTPDPEARRAALDALPGSWDRLRRKRPPPPPRAARRSASARKRRR